MLNDVTIMYNNDNDDSNDKRGGLIINRNDNNDGGVGSDFDDKLNEDDTQTQSRISP